MKGIGPTLVGGVGHPETEYVVALFVEFEAKSFLVSRTTAGTAIAWDFEKGIKDSLDNGHV